MSPATCAVSPDETKLYVVESQATPNRLIRVYDVINGRKLVNDRVFVDAGPGTPDGLRSDIDGNLWCGWGMGTACAAAGGASGAAALDGGMPTAAASAGADV